MVYGGEERRDLKEDFASMQGNHVILNIPQEEEDVWLECTSQTDPFNYLGDFTDNRNVLLIKPDGGKIVKTKAYSVLDNSRITACQINVNESGNFNANVKRVSKGVHYGNIYHLMRQTQERQDLYYKNSWSYLQNLQVSPPKFGNDRENQIFIEELTLTGENLVTKTGSRILLPLNFLVPPAYNVPRVNSRKLPFEISRGATYKDVFSFSIPSNYKIETLPESLSFTSEFGKFELKIESKEEDGERVIEVVREYVVEEGRWSPDLYPAFRDFMVKVNTSSNQKAVLIANN
ncbi:hypothetical protein LZ575_10175 [Antarcticibacterium sp. 1MA-6-2]|uniref:hypothetical protein n=1 Tax=Antarcticibacterium sp. 1MA-6-2 TaxID=2908210 RepID=UPI001F39FAA9|nr:hypothetical protein [Antarcticibacterium sp. 1MA-6-2]UJH92764.1 hypothetical protein LZ575_10175 [Antarcticibacterium sp. 1MA-6-2]